MKRRIDRDALHRSLMRMCFKAEVLDTKLARLGITSSGLAKAAREFRWAADKVEELKGKRL